MESYEWTLPIALGDVSVEYRWGEHLSDRGIRGYFGRLIDTETGEKFNDEQRPWLQSVILEAVNSFRHAELRDSMEIFDSFYPDREAQKSLIIELFERSQRGEFIGQSASLAIANVYMQDIATILRLTEREALELIDELVAESKLGLSGMILVTHESYMDSFAEELKRTGHRALTVSDFGHWSCSVCFAGGDDYSDPKDYPCIKPELDLD